MLTIAVALIISIHPARAEPMTLTVAQIRDLFIGLSGLDGYARVVKDGEREQVVRMPYSFSGGTLLALAKNTDSLKPVVQQFDSARSRLLLQLSGGTGKLTDGTSEHADYLVQLNAMLEKEQTIDLVKIKDEELGLMPPKSNPIPPSVLSQLSPIRAKE